MDYVNLDHEPMQVTSGIVYVLINPAMPGYVKIGKTTNLIQRIAQLNNESVPEPFVCTYAAYVPDRHKVEQLLHAIFDERRATKDREFFKIDPDDVRQVIALMSHEDVTVSAAPNGRPVSEETKVSRKGRIFRNSHLNPVRAFSDEERVIKALSDNGGTFRSQKDLGDAMKLSRAEVCRMLGNCRPHLIERIWDPKTKSNIIRIRDAG